VQSAAGRIEHYAFRAVLAADALPEGVVAIEGDHLEGRADEGACAPDQRGGEGAVEGLGIGDPAEAVAFGVVFLLDGVERVDFGCQEEVHAGCVAEPIEEGRGEALLELPGKGGGRRAEAEDERRGEPGWGGAQFVGEVLDVGPELGAGARRFQLAEIFDAREHDVDAVRVSAEHAGRVDEGLRDLVVRREAGFEMRVDLAVPEGNGGPQRLSRERGCDGNAERGGISAGRGRGFSICHAIGYSALPL
jgi:hypothetical protein